MVIEYSYSLTAPLDIEVRRCNDGVLVFDNTANKTHLFGNEAWDLYLQIQQSGSSPFVVKLPDTQSIAVETEAGGFALLTLLDALESAGLLKKC